MQTLGIDIAGAPGRYLSLALVKWDDRLTGVHSVTWAEMDLGRRNTGYPTFDFEQIRMAVRDGDLGRVSTLSYSIATHVSAGLTRAMGLLEVQPKDIGVIAIDSPSGFSRNLVGHGRATEKVGRHFGLSRPYQPLFQMSPSLLCGDEKRNHWSWMIFGMAAFYFFSTSLVPSSHSWRSFLSDGVPSAAKGIGNRVIEVFPRATTQYARRLTANGDMTIQNLLIALHSLDGASYERSLIRQVLQTGARTGSDRADALLAALTTLGQVYPGSFRSVPLNHECPSKYSPLPPDWNREGIIHLLA